MQFETSRDYHMRRARVELDLAYQAEGRAAMEAHLKLSAMHMAHLRDEIRVSAARYVEPCAALEFPLRGA